MAPMGILGRPDVEESACPYVGLVFDPRTRYLFAHPDHRCHATGAVAMVEPAHQSAYCLASGYAFCPRYVEAARRGGRSGPLSR